MGEQSELDKEENDQIIQVLGNFGKWQLLVILPSAFLRIMVAWELFVSCILYNLTWPDLTRPHLTQPSMCCNYHEDNLINL